MAFKIDRERLILLQGYEYIVTCKIKMQVLQAFDILGPAAVIDCTDQAARRVVCSQPFSPPFGSQGLALQQVREPLSLGGRGKDQEAKS